MWSSSREIMDSKAYPMEALIDTPVRPSGCVASNCKTAKHGTLGREAYNNFEKAGPTRDTALSCAFLPSQYACLSPSFVGTIATDYCNSP